MPLPLKNNVLNRSFLLISGAPPVLERAEKSIGSLKEIATNARATGTISTAGGDQNGLEMLFFDGYAFCGEHLVTTKDEAASSAGFSFDASLHLTGGFCVIFSRATEIRISTDIFGMYGLYYSFGRDYAAVSNRFYDLVELLKAIGEPLSVHHGAVASSLSLVGRIFEQATSTNTMCEQIKFLPTGSFIKIDQTKGTIVDAGTISHITDSNEGYKELLISGAKRIVTNVLAAINKAEIMLSIGLSGGYDSRIILAAFAHLGLTNHNRVYFDSKLRLVDDYRIATRLAGYYDFKLNRPYPEAAHFAAAGRRVEELNPAEAVDEWRKTHGPNYHIAVIGTYSYSNWAASLRSTGGGGELYRDYYKKDLQSRSVADFFETLGSLNEPASTREGIDLACNAVRNELYRLDPEKSNDWRSLRLHYTSWRNKMHFGRVEAMHRPTVNPLLDFDIAKASYMLKEHDLDHNKILFDLFMLLEPALAFLEFDEPRKAFGGHVIRDSLFLGEPLPKLPPTSPIQTSPQTTQ